MKKTNDKGFLIVMADQNIENHLLVKNAIRESSVNHVFTSVYNGNQLMDLLLKRGMYYSKVDDNPDMIIISLKLPLLDGMEALSLIRSNNSLDKIPVYILIENNSEEDITKAREIGASGFFTKPLNYAELQVVVNDICNIPTQE